MPQVINTVTKASPTDNYAVVYDTDLLGSYRIVDNLTARDGIVSNQRKQNMLVFVISTLNYYSLQSDLLTWDNLGTSLGGSAIFIETTRVALQAQITGSTLSKGTYYAITDFQDKNSSDTNSRVIITATSTNTISQTGFWTRLTQNKAYGAFNISTGTAGSVNQITVGATNLMTAVVPYTTSRINTANLVATNVNANSGVSGYSAIVIGGDATTDTPAIIIEKTTAGVDTSTLTVNVTTLTTTFVTNLTMGLAQVNQTLDIAYDITADRIIQCYDASNDIRMAYTTTQISTLTYNPIVNWRWGHPTFRSFNFVGASYRNYFDFPSTSGVNQIETNNSFLSTIGLDGVVMRRTSVASRAFSSNINISLNNCNFLNTTTTISGNNIQVQLTNVSACVNNIVLQDNYGNLAITQLASNGSVRLTSVGFLGATSNSISNNQVLGQLTSNSKSFAIGIQFTGNVVNSISMSLGVGATYLRAVTVTNNVFGIVNGFPSTGDYAITITNNNISGITFNNITTFNITGANKTFTLNNCRGQALTINALTPSDNTNFTNVDFGSGFTMSGSPTTVTVNNTKNTNVTTITLNAVNPVSITGTNINGTSSITASSLTLTNSSISSSTTTFTFNGSTLNLNGCTFGDLFFTGGTGYSLTATNSVFNIVGFTNSANGATYTFTNVNIGNTTFVKENVSGTVLKVTLSNTTTFNCTLTLCDMPNTYTISGCNIRHSNIHSGIVPDVLTFNMTNTQMLYSVIDTISGTAFNTTITNCYFYKATILNNYVTNFILNNTTINYATLSCPDFTTNFSFTNCVFEYNVINTYSSASDYIISNMTISKGRGLYKSNFTFTGASGFGLAGTPCIVLPSMFGQDVFKAIITKATISSITGLTAGAGATLGLGVTTFAEYLAQTLVTTLNTSYQLKNSPTGVANELNVYDIATQPLVANITAGTAEFAIEFTIAP